MMTREQRTVQIAEAFRQILAECGYKDTPANSLEGQPEVAQKLGNLVMDYMIASMYDMNWEGYPTKDLVGVHAFMADMLLMATAK